MTRAAHPARSRSSVAGTTSVTSPISRARSADMRSCTPSKDRRMISWNGIFDSIWIGSNAAVMP